jgi:hypothetical protein
MTLYDLSGPDGRCPGATDDEVFGMLGRWGAAAGWLEGRKLAVVRELIRRRPDERNVGTATDSGLPWDWDDRLAREIALELQVSVPAAQKLLWTAWALEARLPGIGRALDEGRLDAGRAKMVIEETNVLGEPDKLAAAEKLILAGLARCRTWMDLLRLVQGAVVTVDPQGAEHRREQEEKENARVRFWREAAGTCALLGKGLPTDEALKAQAHIEQRARQYRAAGVRRGIDILRVAAYLDLINGVPAADRIARFEAEDRQGQPGARSSDQHSSKPDDNGQEPRESGSRDPGDADRDPSGTPEPDGYPWNWPPDDEPPSDGDPCEQCSPGNCRCRAESAVAAEVNLTLRHIDIPFVTALGYAQRPGEARSLGVLDPALARRLAEAAARHPDTTFCLTIVDQEGRAIGHGCCKPRKPRKQRQSRAGQRDGPPPPQSPSSGPPSAFSLTPSDDPGPPGGFGSWVLTLHGQARELTVDLHPVPTGECGHQYESARHDPGDLLRHLVNVRDGKCGFPACSRHARESDFEHATAFDEGGRTCGCNCWSCSRSCHQVKQSKGWDVTEVRPGYHQWKTPSGRAYTQEPWQYPG